MEEWVVRDPADLGRAIRAFRNQAGIVQEDLAEQAGIHRSYLSDLERGKSTEQTDRLFRVLRRLGIEIVIRRRRSVR
jgi:transcriptional regulator with XRE-family HTH domain